MVRPRLPLILQHLIGQSQRLRIVPPGLRNEPSSTGGVAERGERDGRDGEGEERGRARVEGEEEVEVGALGGAVGHDGVVREEEAEGLVFARRGDGPRRGFGVGAEDAGDGGEGLVAEDEVEGVLVAGALPARLCALRARRGGFVTLPGRSALGGRAGGRAGGH